MKIYDLTHEINDNINLYPGTPQPHVKQLTSTEKDGYRVTSLEFTTHIGTHLDTPSHMISNGKELLDYNISKFCGTAKCVKLEELDSTNIDDVEYLLIATGWDKKWNSHEYFYGQFPLLSDNLIEKITNSNLKGIGLDVPSLDSIDSSNFLIHKKILDSDKIVVENLKDLDKIEDEFFLFTCFPLKFAGKGSLVRAVAISL